MSTLSTHPESAPVAVAPTFGPVQPGERIVSIDFIRGLALLGILLVNVVAFFGPLAALTDPTHLAQLPRADRVAHLLMISLCLGKFISIFSMLFGYGLTGQIEKAAAAGRSPAGFAGRRLGVLALFGLVHALGLWYGDILFVYALLGFCLLATRVITTRDLVIVAVVLLAWAAFLRAGFEIMTGLAAAQSAHAPPLTAPPGLPPALEAMFRARFDPSSPIWIDAETTAYRHGPWTDLMMFRVLSWLFGLLATVFCMGWQILAMFTIGAWMWRVRFFDPEQAGRRWRFFLVCLPVGLALEAAAAAIFWTIGQSDRRLWSVGGAIQAVAVCFLPVGYLSGLSLLAERLPAWVRTPIARAGRMALTVYLLETVVATSLSYYWGLELFGQVGPLTQTGLAVAIWAGLVLFSFLWLSRFRQGPMEWVWRRLEYGR